VEDKNSHPVTSRQALTNQVGLSDVMFRGSKC
jgi:hypothetical protein